MTTERDIPGVVAPPPLIYLASIGAGWGLQRLWPLSLPLAAAPAFAGEFAIAAGAALMLWALSCFRRAGTPANPYRSAAQMVRSGPFRFSRNPMYVGFALLQTGIGLCWNNAWVMAAVVPALLVIRHGVIAREERYLETRFGDEYRRYRAAVRRWL